MTECAVTHQRNPVRVQRPQSELIHKLRASQQQKVKVEEVFELVK